MNVATVIAAEDPARLQVEMLDVLANFGVDYAYSEAWVDFVEGTGAKVRGQLGKIEASWPVDDHHADRSQHITILVNHMDDAGQRPAVLAFLEKRP